MISLLDYSPSTNNQRVRSIEVPGDESARIFSAEVSSSMQAKQEIIRAAYLQIFHQQQMLSHFRLPFLESQFCNNQINVREFVRGLLTSDSFRRLNFDSNDNYRLVELCVQRILGRNVYSDQEKRSWSIIIATQGFNAFINNLLDSEEYIENFGFQIVPYHRKRVLPQRSIGELPFTRMARYGESHRRKLPSMKVLSPVDNSANVYRRALVIPIVAGAVLALSIFVSLVI